MAKEKYNDINELIVKMQTTLVSKLPIACGALYISAHGTKHFYEAMELLAMLMPDEYEAEFRQIEADWREEDEKRSISFNLAAKMDLKEYHIYWYDVYQGGYVKGAFHAVGENGFSLCGRDFRGGLDTKSPTDGGYSNCEEVEPSCKLCRCKLGLPKEEN